MLDKVDYTLCVRGSAENVKSNAYRTIDNKQEIINQLEKMSNASAQHASLPTEIFMH